MNPRDNILSKIKRTPALPMATIKVVGILQNPRAEMSEISRVINHDPGLAANTLRLANSAMFGGHRKIETIDAAIARLGVRRMLDLVVAAAVKPMASAPVRGYDLPAGTLWLHSVAVACATEELAKMRKITGTASAFTAALLIDIGKSILGSHLEVDGQKIRRLAFEQHVPFEQAERQVLGIDHAEAGAALLEHWGLPPALVAAVRWHHEPDRCPGEHQALIDLIHACDQICMLGGIGAGSDGSNYQPSEAVMTRLKIDEGVVEAMLWRIVERLESLKDLIGQTGSV